MSSLARALRGPWRTSPAAACSRRGGAVRDPIRPPPQPPRPVPARLNRRLRRPPRVYDMWIVAAAVAGIAAYLLARRYQEGGR